jgi:hypothetical protein
VSKPRSAAAARDVPQADGISPVRTGLALLLALAGIAYVVYYGFWVLDDGTPATIAELGDWNWLIGFAVFFVGLILASDRRTPLGRGRGIVVGMLGSFLVGLVWIVVYYMTSADASVPLIRELGNYNLMVGIGFMAVGFVFATKWE